MNILYLGDIMGAAGVMVVRSQLQKIRRKHNVDIVIAQSENVTEGRGMSVADYQALRSAGVDAFSGGNWSLFREELYPLLSDPNAPVLRPANYPAGTAGQPYKILSTSKGTVLVISLLGHIVGKDADKPVDNPLHVVEHILDREQTAGHLARIVNFHGDYSSEKVVIGHYLDGRVSMVIGDHWHVPTADARILPGGTAHMTDVGMCGALNASLGVDYDSIIVRWRDGKPTRNILSERAPWQLSGLLCAIDESTGLATDTEHLYYTYDTLR